MSLFQTLMIAGLTGVAGLAAGYFAGQGSSAQAQGAETSSPAYMVVMGTIHNRQAFFSEYTANLPPLYERHGGSYLAVTGEVETLEGEIGFESVVMSVWPNADAARAFWNDPEYRELADARINGNWGDFDVFLVEGFPTQPAEE